MLSNRQVQKLRRTASGSKNRIAKAMELAGVTQVQIAAATGFTQSYISKVKTGDYSDLPVDTAYKFAEFFGCTIEDLFPARQAVA